MHSECLQQVKKKKMISQTPSRLPLHSTEYSKLCTLLAFHCLVKKKKKKRAKPKPNKKKLAITGWF